MLGADHLFEGVCNLNLEHIDRAHRQPNSFWARTVNADGLDLTNSEQRQRTNSDPYGFCPSSPRFYLVWPWGSVLWTRRRPLVVEFSNLQITSPSDCSCAALLTVVYAQKRLRAMIGTEKKPNKAVKSRFQRKLGVRATRLGLR